MKKDEIDSITTDRTKINRIKAEMPDELKAFDLADFFKVFSDSTRLKILLALEKEELCVGDIGEIVGMSVSAVSHQLRSLRAEKLVKTRRDGKTIFYSLDDHHVNEILSIAITHISEKKAE